MNIKDLIGKKIKIDNNRYTFEKTKTIPGTNIECAVLKDSEGYVQNLSLGLLEQKISVATKN